MDRYQSFIPYYVSSGPVFTPFIDDTVADNNQIRYEQHLRSVVAVRHMPAPDADIRLGEASELGMPWECRQTEGGFLNIPQFSRTPQKVELLAAVLLKINEPLAVPVTIWTYAALDVWLNGQLAASTEVPVYKPIRKLAAVLELKPGENLLLIRMQNLAVRDTRNIFGVELLEHREQIEFRLPDEENARPIMELDKWLAELKLGEGRLALPSAPPCPVYLAYERDGQLEEAVQLTGVEQTGLRSDRSLAVVYGEVNGTRRSRKIELLHNRRASYAIVADPEQRRLKLLEELAGMGVDGEFHPLRFGLFYALARSLTGRRGPHDLLHIRTSIEQIGRREDCSDFFLAGLLRMMSLSLLPEELEAEAEQAILNYRYWMTEEGSDGMCFWSENHALMFYICAYMAGKRYPDKIFPRSGRTGEEQSRMALWRIRQWLADVEEYGFEEFLSGDYMCVTCGALLNVVDYMEEEESARAAWLLDLVFKQFAGHSLHGSVIAPQGRIYRSVILPFTQAAQALLYLANPQAPYGNSEWMVFFMNSRYRLPEGLAQLMNGPQEMEYQTGNAWVKFVKRAEYALTSVQSPRNDAKKLFWENELSDLELDPDSNAFVKSLNECYHGTTRFEPGVYGYQQHMWCAALDHETVIFANHPGEAADEGGMRPGYWYGNGIMPAVKQQGTMLGAVYGIGDRHPVGFTHLYFPEAKLDQAERRGAWLFGRKGEGYAGVWCSSPMTPYDDRLFRCEQRVYARHAAYLVQCGSASEHGSLEGFISYCAGLAPVFDETALQLTAADFELTYVACENNSQYI